MTPRTTTILMISVLLAALAAPVIGVPTTEPATTGKCELYRQALAEASIDATNTPEGVVIVITASTPEAVALIQAFWQECGKQHLLGLDCACDAEGDHHGCGSECEGSCPGCSSGCGGQKQGCGKHH